MTDDKLDFLEETPDAEDAPQEVETPEAVEPEAEPEAEPETVEAEGEQPETGEKEEDVPPTPPESKEHLAPITALMDEREKRQEAQRRAEDLERRLADIQRNQQPQERPDFFENPDQAVEQRILGVKLQQSRFLAEKEFGADLVQEAHAYFDQHPQESQQLLNHPSPFHAAVEHYKRQKFLSEVSDPEEWKAAQLATLKEQVMAEMAEQSQQSKPKAPPPSMATATAAGKDAIVKGSAFDQTFPD